MRPTLKFAFLEKAGEALKVLTDKDVLVPAPARLREAEKKQEAEGGSKRG
jgi:hypothetical protein